MLYAGWPFEAVVGVAIFFGVVITLSLIALADVPSVVAHPLTRFSGVVGGAIFGVYVRPSQLAWYPGAVDLAVGAILGFAMMLILTSIMRWDVRAMCVPILSLPSIFGGAIIGWLSNVSQFWIP